MFLGGIAKRLPFSLFMRQTSCRNLQRLSNTICQTLPEGNQHLLATDHGIFGNTNILCAIFKAAYEEFVRGLPITSDRFPRGLSNCKLKRPFCNISEEKKF
jgi:hypothetical protein